MELLATHSLLSYSALTLFAIAYLLIIAEEVTQLKKSKPVVVAAGLIWLLAGIAAHETGLSATFQSELKHTFLEFSELFFFLVVAMTYINAVEERGVFNLLKLWLIKKRFSYKTLFWLTGIFSFFLSPVADNMTTALVMCAVVMAVGKKNPSFVTLSCINIAVAANAGGAFSPFGDLTTLMLWQKNVLPFQTFFKLFIPSLVNALIPAFLLSLAIPKGTPEKMIEKASVQTGGFCIACLFLLTIAITVIFNHYFSIPPVLGMMTGLGLLQIYSYFLNYKSEFDIFKKIRAVEWDTLLFFYGVLLCVGGLAMFGYLQIMSSTMYEQWGSHFSPLHQHTLANVMIGILSALIDNIPLMYAVLTMEPNMSQGQWLLIALTTGVGGSLLSIGSAAGVALMGQSKGLYTFMGHLRWSWAILLGYFGSILTHFLINKDSFLL